MRKMMTKEVTKTIVKIAKMMVVDGSPTATTMPDEVMIGNVSQEKAQTAVTKKHGAGVMVFGVKAETDVYQMAVEDFIKVAELVKEPEAEEAPTEQQAS